MKVSLNWVKEFTTVDLTVEELVEKIGAQLGAVEEVTDVGKRYEGIVVVEVLSCEKHQDADKLSVCIVSDGGVIKDVQRESDGHVQVVCGAPNVKAGMLAAWIPPGVVVPSTLDKDPFKIEAKDIRGVVSNGMLASPKELGLGDSHEGLLVVDKDVTPGTAFAEAYNLNDYIIDIENKMFTHRPDLFGMLGVAREIAGIQGNAFKSPDWYKQDVVIEGGSGLKLEVNNEVADLVPRFCLLPMSGVKIAPSSAAVQSKLTAVGIKPINNVVDITNYLMMETAQPLHAYDYDKLKTAKIGVRRSKNGEVLKLLGGKDLKLNEGSVVITDGEKPIGLAGVMGGADTEVDENTKNIILECGTFDMNATRKSAMQYGLFTDAATRFTKGQSPLQNVAVIARAAEKVTELAGGQPAGEFFDIKSELKEDEPVIETTHFINERLGLSLSLEEMSQLLKNVEMTISDEDGSSDPNPGEKDYPLIIIYPPFWRTDIEIPEDIVEEVGRLYGYDHLPMILPTRDLTPAAVDKTIELKSRLRKILTAAGANEVLTYSFVHGSLLDKIGQPIEKAYQLRNALSPDLQYYRLSLIPSLLEKIHPNIKLGYDNFVLFELGKSHNKDNPDDGEEKVPKEFNTLALVATAGPKVVSRESGAGYFLARAYLDYFAKQLGIRLKYSPLNNEPGSPTTKTFDFNRCAVISIDGTDITLGMIGEFKPETVFKLKLPTFSAGFEIGIDELLLALPKESVYKSLTRFPKVEQDITLSAPSNIYYGKLAQAAKEILENIKPNATIYTFEALDIYQKDDATKHFSFRLSISSYDKTLKAEEINSLLDELAERLKDKIGIERV